MNLTRRDFCNFAGSSFALGFGLRPSLAKAAQREDRALVVIYLAGGNDGLSFVQPYLDPHLRLRRPTIALDPALLLQIGEDGGGAALAFHPNLQGLKSLYDRGHVAVVQRVGYENASRSHFLGSDILSSASPEAPQGYGWLARYMESAQSPIDPLMAWNTQFQVPRTLAGKVARPASITDPVAYAYYGPWNEMDAAVRLAADREGVPTELAFLNATTSAALTTIGRVGKVQSYKETVAYPQSSLGNSLRLVASAIASGVGTQIYWVQASGYDTHANQGVGSGRYAGLLLQFDRALSAFYQDLENQSLAKQTLILQYSEFGRRIDENGSAGTDHGAAGVMTALGGAVSGGLYGRAPESLEAFPDNPDLENGGRDLRPDIDFRSVYAHVLDNWLMTSSVPILGHDYRDRKLGFL